MDERFLKIRELLRMVRDLELGRLEEVSRQQDGLRRQIAELERQRDARRRSGHARETLQEIVAAEGWRIWVEHRIRDMNREISVLEGRKEGLKQAARSAVGRLDAFERILRRRHGR